MFFKINEFVYFFNCSNWEKFVDKIGEMVKTSDEFVRYFEIYSGKINKYFFIHFQAHSSWQQQFLDFSINSVLVVAALTASSKTSLRFS